MALILGNLYEETRQRFQLTLIAGENGLQNLIKWVYVAEDYTTSNFLQGGELIITTGVTSGGSSQWLLHFLQHITAQGTCGLILNEGNYIRSSEISQEVLDFCNTQNVPLFLMPWHIHIYDITREYYNRIFMDARRSEDISRAFLMLVSSEKEQDAAIHLLNENHFPSEADYYIASFHFPSRQKITLLDDERLNHHLVTQLLHFSFPCHLVTTSGSFFLVCQQNDLVTVDMVIQTLCKVIAEMYPQLPCFIGVSAQIDGLSGLSSGLKQAKAALPMGEYRQISLTHYEKLGFFKLLNQISNLQILRAYVDEQLAAVHTYDRRHQSDFSRTLQLYLENNHSIQTVAELSFCHRNTVSHRLHLIREKMGYRLDQPEICFALLTAFQVEEYLRIMEEN